MNKKELEKLSDGEVAALVERLECGVKEKRNEVESINKELREIQQSILEQQTDRRKFAKNLLQAEEAAPLIEESRKLRRQLREKQNQLKQLSKGEAKEQSEIRDLESRLDELRSKTEITSLEDGNKENTEAIQSLEAAHKERQDACERVTEELSKIQAEADHLKSYQCQKQAPAVTATATARQKPKHAQSRSDEQQTLSRKLDKLILKSSREAGLKL